MAGAIRGVRLYRYLVVPFVLLVTCSACVTGSAIPTGASRYEPAPASKSVDTYFRGQRTGLPYEEIGIVKAQYRSGTGLSSPDVEQLLPTLHAKARQLGADGVIITTVSDHPFGGLHPAYMTNPILEVVAVAIR